MARLPINIERVCLVFCNTNAFPSNASLISSIRIAKLGRWVNSEVFFIENPDVREFGDVLCHFSSYTTKELFIYFAGNPISQDYTGDKSILKLRDGSISPDSFYSSINDKPNDLKIIIAFDGTNDPEKWNPENYALTEPGVIFIAPYPDLSKAHLQQFDLKNESIFVYEMYLKLKSDPYTTGQDIQTHLQKILLKFGQKVSCTSHPPELKNSAILVI
ncbi:Clan CD, family C14, metacaspase-like cysteine peptidase [Histomonas meleagridis]|uniref:Clan CD, family C14, metacaspase-like cysteine peptidase n=1 Tax=Histomonas meleagridis TaxID=135588 RepID=UPI003559C563|nr:Clan CD, family C14, metacaspase-like cysteine peptidase [Histomonas meleagridis]KAH0798325.1 Clan CD, family C14, metacaspase-like cysteine peptidase [Histomonas meleagridis]